MQTRGNNLPLKLNFLINFIKNVCSFQGMAEGDFRHGIIPWKLAGGECAREEKGGKNPQAGDLKERLGKGKGSPAAAAIFLLLSALLRSPDTQ